MFLNEVIIHERDRVLIEQLKLTVCGELECDKVYYLGRVRGDHGSWCKVWMEALPAKFWVFQIFSAESGELCEIRTGSGDLVKYWSTAEAIMNSMVSIKNKGYQRKGDFPPQRPHFRHEVVNLVERQRAEIREANKPRIEERFEDPSEVSPL